MAKSTVKLFWLLVVAIWAGCAQVGEPIPPSLELPRQVTDLQGLRKGNMVVLSWTPPTRITDGQTIQHLGPTRVCRSLHAPMTQCEVVVAELRSSLAKPAREFKDQISAALQNTPPDASARYAVEVLNANGRSAGLSNQVVIPYFPTLAAPLDLQAQATAQGMLLQWTWPANPPAASTVEYFLRIYRRDESGSAVVKVGDVPMNSGAEPQLVDHSLQWEHTYIYRATYVSSGANDLQVEGEDSTEVRVVAHDVFPPGAPSGLQAVFSSVGQPNFIDLTWSPNIDEDLAGYNVYRWTEGNEPVKINAELAKIPTYRDRDVRPGEKYFYSVTAVDSRGNESQRSESSSESVPDQP
jgi:hypothetical protein